ncbi:MAG TPA: hypothetical protein VKI41_12245 [Vicinamibacteria bacterium]|nr:hypothetical protein [Vicinamibacteria bacterium]
MLGDEDLALEMRQAWTKACDRAVEVFGMSMLDQPRPSKLPPSSVSTLATWWTLAG